MTRVVARVLVMILFLLAAVSTVTLNVGAMASGAMAGDVMADHVMAGGVHHAVPSMPGASMHGNHSGGSVCPHGATAVSPDDTGHGVGHGSCAVSGHVCAGFIDVSMEIAEVRDDLVAAWPRMTPTSPFEERPEAVTPPPRA